MLNDSMSVKHSTRKRVREVIDQVQYRPNQAARTLVTSRTRTIGVLMAQTAHYGPTTSLHAIESAARDAGYLVSTSSLSSGDYQSITVGLQHLIDQAVEGLVVISPQVRVFEAVAELAISEPLVTLDQT
ncbi:MAG: LacI family DNA-binding transcriptional regulator, partial [Microbacteriaceae bacterium]